MFLRRQNQFVATEVGDEQSAHPERLPPARDAQAISETPSTSLVGEALR